MTTGLQNALSGLGMGATGANDMVKELFIGKTGGGRKRKGSKRGGGRKGSKRGRKGSKRGGDGVIATAAVPFGLLALQRYFKGNRTAKRGVKNIGNTFKRTFRRRH